MEADLPGISIQCGRFDHCRAAGRPGARRPNQQWHVPHVYPRGGRGAAGLVRQLRPGERAQLHRAAPGTCPQGGGAWADPLNYIATNGSNPNGSGIAAGGGFMGIPVAPWSCGNGCSNDSEIFSFHPEGSNVTFGDGSVQFVRNQLTMNQAQALLSHAGARSSTSITNYH